MDKVLQPREHTSVWVQYFETKAKNSQAPRPILLEGFMVGLN